MKIVPFLIFNMNTISLAFLGLSLVLVIVCFTFCYKLVSVFVESVLSVIKIASSCRLVLGIVGPCWWRVCLDLFDG